MYSPQFSNLVKFLMKHVKNCNTSMQAVEITLLEALGQLKINFELMREVKIRLRSFIVNFFKF